MRNTLVITKGHPFDKAAYFGLLDRVFTRPGLGEYTHVEHPAAAAVFAQEALDAFDVILFYDMPGIEFVESSARGVGSARTVRGRPRYLEPTVRFKQRLLAATQRGIGLVFTHHAIAGWPAWEAYAELIGGRFCYTPQTLRGRRVADSGYRHAVTHEVSVVAEHPVTAGLPAQFTMTDELYLYEVFEEQVQPLLRSSHDFVDTNFYSAARAVVDGEMFSNRDWSHAPGSDLVGWTRQHNASRIVYLQGGDDVQAYDNAHYQTLLGNAIHWAAKAC